MKPKLHECIENIQEDILTPLPLDYQEDFFLSESRRLALLGGYGSGKSECAIRWLVKQCINKDLYCAICGVSFERHLKDVILNRLSKYYDNIIVKDKHTILLGDSKIQLYGIGKATDTHAFASEEFDIIVCDEWTLCPVDNIRFLPTRLRRKDRPNRLLLSGIPPDRGSDHHNLIKDFDVYTWTSEANPMLADTYWNELCELFPEGALRDKYVRGLIVDSASLFKYSDFQTSDDYPVMNKVIAVDPARAEKGDDFAVVCLGKLGEKVYIVDLFAGQNIPIDDQSSIIAQMSSRHEATKIGIEDNGYQKTLLDILKKTCPHAIGVTSKINKITRAQMISSLWANHNLIWSINDLKLLNKARDQFLSFPNGKHDDIVDAVSLGYKLLQTSNYKAGDEVSGVRKSYSYK